MSVPADTRNVVEALFILLPEASTQPNSAR